MYEIRNDSEIFLYDSIERGLTAPHIIEALRGNEGRSYTLRINSGGGETFEALALYNVLKPHDVKVYIDGLCASAASIIAMAGSRIYMPKNALMMIHNPAGQAMGESSDMRDMAELLDKIRDNVAGIYQARTQLDLERIIELMDAETWMNGDEAYSLGFCDEVTGEIRNTAKMSYDDGVKAERLRMKALDELNAPGREGIISAAKYETFRTASDIALEILRSENRTRDAKELEGLSMWQSKRESAQIDMMAGKINLMRGIVGNAR